jgi:hypothetical protein
MEPIAEEALFWTIFLQTHPHVASVYFKVPGVAGVEITRKEPDDKHSNSDGREGNTVC